MSKKPILSKRPKKFLALILVCLIAIALTGCDSSNRKPTADLDLNATYASTENYKVTAGEVYNKLRYNAVSYVENEVYKHLYADEIETVKKDLKSETSVYKERIENEILEDIYGTSDEEEIDDLTTKERTTAVKTYVDEMYNVGYKITETQVNEKEFASVYSYYYLEVAKYVAAYNKLADEFSKNEDGSINFGEINDDSYFTESEVVSWYKNNHMNKGDITGILVRFINSDEATNVLKKFGLYSSGGKWYQIKLSENESEWNTKTQYDKYYKNYTLDLTGESGLISIDELGNGNATVLKVFAEIYNYVYTYRTPIDFNLTTSVEDFADKGHLNYYYFIQSIIEEDRLTKEANTDNTEYDELVEKLLAYEEENNETIVMSKERLDKYSSSLTSYFYTSLATEAAEEGKTYTQYITTAKQLGSYYYFLYKIDQVEDKVLYEEIENEDDETEIKFTDTDFLNEILNELFEDEINDTYINNEFSERVKEAELKIYDSIIEAQFMYTSSSELVDSYEQNKSKDNNLIAEVKYNGQTKKITVKDAYSYLEPLYGTQIASNLLFQKFIKDQDCYKDLEKDYDKYVETIKSMLYYFANDYYASNGYPASIGKYNFMMLYFGTANVDEVVSDFLMVSDATNAFYADYSKHGFDTNNFYENILTYSEDVQSKFYSLTVSGLTVYYDKDEDGVADEITTDIETEQAKALLDKAYDVVINSKASYETALNDVVSNFNSSSRIASENPTTPEYTWAEYRSLGLNIKVSSFGTVTDTTDGADSAIVTRVEKLYPIVVDEKLGFTAQYLDDETLTLEENELTKLLVTAGSLKTSAKFETEIDEELELYKEISIVVNDKREVITMNYESDDITLEQVKVYAAEYVLLGDVYSLPTTTKAALDAYVLPLITKYTGAASQLTITRAQLGEITFHTEGGLSDQFNEAFTKDYARSSFFDEYTLILQRTDDNYEDTYAGWWENMYKGGNN